MVQEETLLQGSWSALEHEPTNQKWGHQSRRGPQKFPMLGA